MQEIPSYGDWIQKEQAARELFQKKYPLEKDPFRQKFHLMPPVGYINDSNGLCFFRGIYHVYHQYCPFSPWGEGGKLWGHYETENFVTWRRRPPAGAPDTPWDRDGMYSGSALPQEDGIRFYYTGNVKESGDFDYIHEGREHNLIGAFSKDGKLLERKVLLMRNSDYPGDVTLHVRDPKVWREKGKYYMVLGARSDKDKGLVLLYSSGDGLKWKVEGRFFSAKHLGYMWECPDMFRLGKKRILLFCPQGLRPEEERFQNGDTCGYAVISRDFRLGGDIGAFEELDRGFDFYAAQTFSGTGERRILLGWMGLPNPYENPTVAYGWQHCLSLPRELSFRKGKLCQEPLQELEALRKPGGCGTLFKGEKLLLPADCFEVLLYPEEEKFHAAFRQDAELVYDGERLTLRLGESGFGRKERSCRLPEKINCLRIFSDVSSLEIFVNGEVFSTRLFETHSGSKPMLRMISGSCRWELYPLCPFEWEE